MFNINKSLLNDSLLPKSFAKCDHIFNVASDSDCFWEIVAKYS